MKKKIIVSACLLGRLCKYSGGHNACPALITLLDDYEIIPVCPEVSGGLPIPRDPSERKGDRIYTANGKDVTDFFLKGCQLELTKLMGQTIKCAVLKENSPSCGVHAVYDGHFTSTKIPGQGMFAEMLMQQNIPIFSERDIDQLYIFLKK